MVYNTNRPGFDPRPITGNVLFFLALAVKVQEVVKRWIKGRVIQNFSFRKFISDQAFSCSFWKWNAEKPKNFWNRTTFRWCPGQSKFYYIAPLMNYSQYSLERYKILVYGLGKNLKKKLNHKVSKRHATQHPWHE